MKFKVNSYITETQDLNIQHDKLAVYRTVMKMVTVCRYVTQCSLVGRYRLFWGCATSIVVQNSTITYSKTHFF